MIKKLAALLLVLLLALGATSAVAEGESHLQRVLDSGVLRVAMIPENPGWSVMDGSAMAWKWQSCLHRNSAWNWN